KLTMVRDPDRALEDRAIRVGVLEALVGFLGESLGAERAATMRESLRRVGLKDEDIQHFLDAAQAVHDSLHQPWHDSKRLPPVQPDFIPAPNDVAGVHGDRQRAAPDLFGQILQLVPLENEDIAKAGGLRTYPFHYAQAVSGITVMMVML